MFAVLEPLRWLIAVVGFFPAMFAGRPEALAVAGVAGIPLDVTVVMAAVYYGLLAWLLVWRDAGCACRQWRPFRWVDRQVEKVANHWLVAPALQLPRSLHPALIAVLALFPLGSLGGLLYLRQAGRAQTWWTILYVGSNTASYQLCTLIPLPALWRIVAVLSMTVVTFGVGLIVSANCRNAARAGARRAWDRSRAAMHWRLS